MKASLKVEFQDEDSFIIYYVTDKVYENEEEYKELFKVLNDRLNRVYNYIFHGFYDVTIHYCKGIYVLQFDYIDDYGRRDFNVTIFLNSDMLYEFDDDEFINDTKIYFDGMYYVEIAKVLNDIRLFENGNIIYGKDAEKVLSNGVLIK